MVGGGIHRNAWYATQPPAGFFSSCVGKMLIYSVNQIDGSLALLNSLLAWEPNIALVSDPLGRALVC